MSYEKYGVRQLRQDLSDVLSKVERNKQRIVIGKNSDEVAVLVPVSDLDVLEELDAKRAEQALESLDLQALKAASDDEKSESNALFDGFQEKEIDTSRYEDEESRAKWLESISKQQLFNVSTEQTGMPALLAALNSLPENQKKMFDKVYEMINLAVMERADSVTEIYNTIAAVFGAKDVKGINVTFVDAVKPQRLVRVEKQKIKFERAGFDLSGFAERTQAFSAARIAALGSSTGKDSVSVGQIKNVRKITK